jgi:UDP-glucose 4-epimerase
MKTVWVVGAGGLLGAALWHRCSALGDEVFVPAERLAWAERARLMAQLQANVSAFAGRVGASASPEWEVYWAAGVGTMSSPAEALLLETEALGVLLEALASNPVLAATQGAIGFASSAGAIYAGAMDELISEVTPVAPTTPYARAKLQQEDLVRAFAAARPATRALLARFSTLYGTGQAVGKQQGLLTHIARSIVRHEPIQIFVPFDTIRDYLRVEDAAAHMICALRETEPAHQLTKIIASEHPTTIAEIVATFRRLARRSPRIVTSASQRAGLYGRRMQFRSNLVLHGHDDLPATNLTVGIAQLLDAERARFTRPAER